MAMRRYRRGVSFLSMFALFGAANLVFSLTDTAFYLIFSPFLPSAVYELGAAFSVKVGATLPLTVGIFLSLITVALWVILRIFSVKSPVAMGIAVAYYAVDTVALSAFSLAFNYSVGLVDIGFHVLALILLIMAAHAASVLRRSPAPSEEVIGEMIESLAVPPEGLPLGTEIGDRPPDAEDTVPLRAAEARGRVLLGSDVFGLSVRAVRSYGLTELVVRDQVYAERRGVAELVYSLTATVDGHRITLRFSPGRFYGRMILLVDGRLAADIRRYL